MEFTVGGGEISFYFMNFFHVGKFYKEHLLFCKKKIRKFENKATQGETKGTPNFTTYM